MSKLIKKCSMPLAFIIITLAIVFSIFRALTPIVEQYKGEIEHKLTFMLGKPVMIKSLETSWYWFEPVLKLNQVTVVDANQDAVHLQKLLVGINLFSSLWHWQIQPGVLFIDDFDLTIREKNKHWLVDGFNNQRSIDSLKESQDYVQLANWFLSQQKIIIKNLSARVYLSDGTLLPLDKVDFKVLNKNGHYRIKGNAELAQTVPTSWTLLADMYINAQAFQKTSGHMYLSVDHFLPGQWQGLFPLKNVHIEGGNGHLEAWLDFNEGTLKSAQSRFDINHLGWRQGKNKTHYFIQEAKANLAWLPDANGWHLFGDRVVLRFNGHTWPQNTFQIDFNRNDDSYLVFVQHLLLKPILNFDANWPKALRPLFDNHLTGDLRNTTFSIRHHELDSLSLQFNHLTIGDRHHPPMVKGLSGTLNWHPDNGFIKLNTQNATLTPAKLPTVSFEQLNADLSWNKSDSGTHYHLNHALILRPDFILSAQATLDQSVSSPQKMLNLSGEFTGEDVEKWLSYLPAKHLKPKLDLWLKHNIKQIKKMGGSFKIHGDINDFPFDTTPGDFKINTHLSGVDLLLTNHWPLTKNINANLSFDKRFMNVDIIQADLQGIPVSNINLRMHDIGLDRETLLMHGKVRADAHRLQTYIFSTPLKTKLARLSMLELFGPLILDLSMEIPLYKGGHEVLAEGGVEFKDNQVNVHHRLDSVELKHLSGHLQFDEHGIKGSALNAEILGDPVDIKMHSVRGKSPYTSVRLKGHTTIELLREKFKLPIFSLMHGDLNLDSLITITDDPNDLDHIHIKTPLKGVAIHLPKPIGKTPQEITPLSIDVDFNPKKALQIYFNYDDRVSSNLWFKRLHEQFILNKGTVRIGSGSALKPKNEGVQILGDFDCFDVNQWREALKAIPSDTNSTGIMELVHFVDLKFKTIRFLKKQFNNAVLKASKLDADKWSVSLNQASIMANLYYQPSQNALRGTVKELHLNKSMFSSQKSEPNTLDLQPQAIPNLNLTINQLYMDDLNLGQMTFASLSKPKHWYLQHCTIDSEDYHLAIKGDWYKTTLRQKTTFKADLTITDLASSLKRFHIPPVVEAREGHIAFKGGWPDDVDDVSLAKIAGKLDINFKLGRITSLSPETEQKLGLGKLLSILSLQTIPRRLQLDFSDLSKAGYSFDEFKGHFALKDGVLTTKDSYIDGPVAYASMTGSLNVAKQQYDLDLNIAPHITASLPVVATIAGGPVAGVATWLVSKLISQSMKKVNGYTYKISGPWTDPLLQQVSISSKR